MSDIRPWRKAIKDPVSTVSDRQEHCLQDLQRSEDLFKRVTTFPVGADLDQHPWYLMKWIKHAWTTVSLDFPLTKELNSDVFDLNMGPRPGYSVAMELKLVRKEPTLMNQYVIKIQK
jgi:hypothetical protein